jgi:hypothetical protein
LEYAVVLAVLAIVVVFALLIGFGAFAVHKMKPDKLRIYGESKLAKFGLEIGRSAEPGVPEKPHVLELPPDDRRELEA